MDYNSWAFTLILLLSLRIYTSSEELQSPSNVTVVIQDGEATMVWVPPAQAPLGVYYKVQLAQYRSQLNWTTVPGCERVLSTHCDLTSFTTRIDMYWARVQTAKEEMTSKWSKSRRFSRRDSELLPPAFTLSSSSRSVKVRVHRKPALKDTFPNGLKYTYRLQEKGLNSTVTKWVPWMGEMGEEQTDVEFDYLTWGREYCVHLEVEDIAGEAVSGPSAAQCILLPQPGWYTAAIVAALCLSGVAVLGLLGLLLHCFLWRPKTLPSTLKSPSSAWQPLILGEAPVEKVIGQGWLLINEKKSREQEEKQKAMEDEERETRRDSMDSGVSVDRPASETGGGGDGDSGEMRKQEDSGCGSLGGTDGDSGDSRRVSEERPLLDGRNPEQDASQKEDSGLGLGCGIPHNRSGVLQEKDCGHHPVDCVVSGDGYRSQKPSSMVVQDIEREQHSKGITGEADSSIAMNCVCLGKGLCLWCNSVAPRPTKGHSVCSYPTSDPSHQFPISSISCIPDNYLKKSNLLSGGNLVHSDTSFVCCIPQTESSESVPLLLSVPQLPLVCGGLDGSVNALSLSLQDVELTFG